METAPHHLDVGNLGGGRAKIKPPGAPAGTMPAPMALVPSTNSQPALLGPYKQKGDPNHLLLCCWPPSRHACTLRQLIAISSCP